VCAGGTNCRNRIRLRSGFPGASALSCVKGDQAQVGRPAISPQGLAGVVAAAPVGVYFQKVFKPPIRKSSTAESFSGRATSEAHLPAISSR